MSISTLGNPSKNLEENDWAIQSLIDDMITISKLGGIGVVLHQGKQCKNPDINFQQFIKLFDFLREQTEIFQLNDQHIYMLIHNTEQYIKHELLETGNSYAA